MKILLDECIPMAVYAYLKEKHLRTPVSPKNWIMVFETVMRNQAGSARPPFSVIVTLHAPGSGIILDLCRRNQTR